MSALTDLFTNIANAIRAKKRTTGAISAEDFANEIASIPYMPTIEINRTKTLHIDFNAIVSALNNSLTEEQKALHFVEGDASDITLQLLFGTYYDVPNAPIITNSFGFYVDVTDYSNHICGGNYNYPQRNFAMPSQGCSSILENYTIGELIDYLDSIASMYVDGIGVFTNSSYDDYVYIHTGIIKVVPIDGPEISVDMGSTPYIWVT